MLVSASWAPSLAMGPKRTMDAATRQRKNRLVIASYPYPPAPAFVGPGILEMNAIQPGRLTIVLNVRSWHRSNLALAKLLARFPHRPQHRRPVFEVSGKDFLHHPMGQLRNQTVQRFRRVSHFVRQTSPVQIVRVPGLSQQTAGVTHEGRKRLQVQQLSRVILRQGGMGNPKILRQPLPAYFRGIAARKTFQFLARLTPVIALPRIS